MLGQNIRKIWSILLIGLLVFAQLTIVLPKIMLAADSRLAGSDRYHMAVQVSQAGWHKSDYVIVVRGDDFADALCAGPLAKKYNAPILFTEKYRLNTSTLKEIKRLEADRVIIIGGYGAISRNIDNTLDSEGINEIERIYGANRYETSVKIAQRLGSKEAALATGGEYADALSISAVAAAKGFSILLTYPDDLPSIVQQHLNNYKLEKIYLIGGEKAITKHTEQQVHSPLRLAGKNRYETNRLVLEYFAQDLDFNKIFTAPGEGKDNYTYALAGAALAAQTSSPIVLNSSILPEETKDFVRSKMTVASEIIALGGKDVVPTEVLSQYRQGFNQIIKSIFDQEGVYGPSIGTTTIAGSLAIENSNIIVQNTVIEGDLLLGEGISYGTVELRNVTVKGRTTIRGGRDHSIIGDNFIAASVILDSEGEKVADLTLRGKSKINKVLVHSHAYLDDSENTGEGFTDVDILRGKRVILKGGFNTVSFTAKSVDVRLNSATVKTLNAYSGGNIWGTGTINTANISSNDVDLDIIPAVTNVAKGYQAYVGGKRLSEGTTRAADIAALQNEPIRNLKATAGNGQVSFTFSQPTDATGVILKQSTDGGSTWKNASTGSLNKYSTSATATGLTNGQKYYFMLVVTGGTKAGESNKVAATPVENGITDLAGIPGNGKATLAFSPPTGATGVTLQQSLDGGLTWKNSSTSSTLNQSSTSALVTGLVNGSTYQFKLVVVGGSRAGDSNVITLIPVDPIGDLKGFSPESGTITLTFSAAPGATKITLRQSSDGGFTWEERLPASGLNDKSTSATITKLISGQEYNYKLLVIGGARAGESNIATVIAQ
jgi:putative cell wall-binding protein